VVEGLKSGACLCPVKIRIIRKNFQRNTVCLAFNLLGSSAQGHECFLKYLLGAQHGVQAKIGVMRAINVRGGFGMNCGGRQARFAGNAGFSDVHNLLYSDIVCQQRPGMRKRSNTSDMHPFIHPLSKAVDPAWNPFRLGYL